MSDRDHRKSGGPAGGRDEQSGQTGVAGTLQFQLLAERFGAAGAQRYVQRKLTQRRAARREQSSPGAVQSAAQKGVSGPGGPLPHLEAIQKSFGRHDVSPVQAHTDGAAAEATAAMGAEAFASGDHVAFGGAPSLHTAAHEAAHVIQQRGGVQLKSGVGHAGDGYEQQADAVADRVVKGQSSEELLDQAAPSGARPAESASSAVQRKITLTDTQEELSWLEASAMLIDGESFMFVEPIGDEVLRQLDKDDVTFPNGAAMGKFVARSKAIAEESVAAVEAAIPEPAKPLESKEEADRSDAPATPTVAAALDQLASLSPLMRRLVVTNLKPKKVQDLFSLARASRPTTRVELLDEIAGQLAVHAAKGLEGKLAWSGPSTLEVPVPKSAKDRKVGKGSELGLKQTGLRKGMVEGAPVSEEVENDYAAWVNDKTGTVPPPGDQGAMNCWQAVLYTCCVAGLIPKAGLRSIHERACNAAGGKDVARAAAAYDAAVLAYLKVGAQKWDHRSPIPAGHVLLFDGLGHVALSMGSQRATDFRGTTREPMMLHDAMSLWRADDGRNARFENRSISVEELAAQCGGQNYRLINSLGEPRQWDEWKMYMEQCEVMHAPAPWR